MSDEELENDSSEIFRRYKEKDRAAMLEAHRSTLKEFISEITKNGEKKLKKAQKNKKRDREDDSKPVVVAAAPVAKPEAVESKKKEEKEEEWTCAGRVWENPPIPCQGGPKSNEKAGIQINGENGGKRKNITVCKTCKLAKQKATRNKNKKNKNE